MKAMLRVTPLPALTDNYIWLIEDLVHRQVVAVDPGDATPVLAYCHQHQYELAAILVTHHHPDHIGGIAQLAREYNIPIYGPARENIPLCTHPLNDEETIRLPNLNTLELAIMEIPGHTAGHIAYYSNDWLFCGDTLFAGGCGRLFEGTPAQMLTSLKKLCALPPSTQIFCAHEYTLNNLEFALTVDPNNTALQARLTTVRAQRERGQMTLPSSLEIEMATNPFLRASRLTGLTQGDELSIFTQIRQMKDNW